MKICIENDEIERITIDISPTVTYGYLKQIVNKKTSIPICLIKLSYNGKDIT